MTEVTIRPTKEQSSDLAARHILSQIVENPELVLGVATGSTPLPLYAALAELGAQGGVDFSRLTVFALDEYLGLPVGHPESYSQVVRREITDRLGVDASRVHVPDADPAGLDTAGLRYEQLIQDAGGVDVQIVGIGSNGHIAFNEPGASHQSLTRVENLTEQTRVDNARFFESLEQVPYRCITQGIGTILRAREVIMLAFGEGKAEAIAAALTGPITEDSPASALQRHPRLRVYLDTLAASRLPESVRLPQSARTPESVQP